MLNVGKRSVERARKVLDKGAPELVEAVESGNIAVSTAAALTKLPAAEQRAAASRPAEAAAIASRLNKEKRALDESPAPSDRFRDVAVVKAPVRVLTEKEILEVRGALASFAMAGRRIKLLIDSEALGAIVNLIVLLESRLPPRKQGSAADGLLPPGQAA